jgi:hypothetical protein
MKAYRVTIRLADDEWGSELMARVARQYCDEHPDLDPLVVEVIEHAGWFLTFTRSGVCVDTANDTACLSRSAHEFFAKVRGSDWQYVGSIDRNDLKARKESA